MSRVCRDELFLCAGEVIRKNRNISHELRSNISTPNASLVDRENLFRLQWLFHKVLIDSVVNLWGTLLQRIFPNLVITRLVTDGNPFFLVINIDFSLFVDF